MSVGLFAVGVLALVVAMPSVYDVDRQPTFNASPQTESIGYQMKDYLADTRTFGFSYTFYGSDSNYTYKPIATIYFNGGENSANTTFKFVDESTHTIYNLYNNNVSSSDIYTPNHLMYRILCENYYTEVGVFADIDYSETFSFFRSPYFFDGSNIFDSYKSSYGGFTSDAVNGNFNDLVSESSFCIFSYKCYADMIDTIGNGGACYIVNRLIYNNPSYSFNVGEYIRLTELIDFGFATNYTGFFVAGTGGFGLVNNDFSYVIPCSLVGIDLTYDIGANFGFNTYVCNMDLSITDSFDVPYAYVGRFSDYWSYNNFDEIVYYQPNSGFNYGVSLITNYQCSICSSWGWLYVIPFDADENDNVLVKERGYILQYFNELDIEGNNSYNTGFVNGYNSGYSDGETYGETVGYSNGYQVGYRNGLNDGTDTNTTLMGLFGSIADTPVIMLRSLFNFDLFGVNVLTAVLSLLTAIITIYVIRKFI